MAIFMPIKAKSQIRRCNLHPCAPLTLPLLCIEFFFQASDRSVAQREIIQKSMLFFSADTVCLLFVFMTKNLVYHPSLWGHP